MKLTKIESSILVYVRVMSMILIVACHILQAYANHWAFILNIGVQIFLVLSGYLYGYKFIDDWKLFIKKRILKLYIPFATFLVLVFPLYLLFTNLIGWKTYAINFLNLQGISFVIGEYMITGIRHLWFMTAIMCGYFCLPILQNNKKFSSFILLGIGVSMALGYTFINEQIMFFYSWLYLFSAGYCFSNIRKSSKWLYVVILFVLICIILFNTNWNNITNYFDIKNRLLHDIGGVLSVIIPTLIFTQITFFAKTPSIIKVFDKYSFHIYITHYFFIFGPFSLITITNYMVLNIIFVLLATWGSCLILEKLSGYIQRKSSNYINL